MVCLTIVSLIVYESVLQHSVEACLSYTKVWGLLVDEPTEAESPEALFRIGLSHYNQQRFEEALPYFDRAIQGDHSLGKAWAFRGATYIALEQDPTLVVRDLDHALTLLEPPIDENSRRMRGLLLGFRGAALCLLHRYAEAATGFEDARQYRLLPAWLSIRQGESYRALGQNQLAIAAYRRALEDPQRERATPDSWLQTAEALLELGDYPAAVDATRVAIERQPENALIWALQARALLALKRYQECLDSIERALAIDDQSYFAWGVKGAAARGLKRYEEAREAYHHAHMLALESPQARGPNIIGEFRMLLRLGRFGAAWRLAIGEAERRLNEQQEQHRSHR